MIRKIRESFYKYRPEPLEFQGALISFFVVVWVGWPFSHQFSQFDSDMYRALVEILPHPVLGLWFFSLFLFHIYGLFRNNLRFRRVSAFLGSITWILFTTVYVLDSINAPSVLVFPVIALSQMWVYLRLGVTSDS